MLPEEVPSDVTAGALAAVKLKRLLEEAALVPLYVVTQFVATVAHEGGHALVATVLFQKVRSIRLYRNAGGGTDAGEPPWLFAIFIGMAGYLGPSTFGLLAVALLIRGLNDAVLWASIGFLLLMLVVVRGPFGWFIVPALMLAIRLLESPPSWLMAWETAQSALPWPAIFRPSSSCILRLRARSLASLRARSDCSRRCEI